MSPLSPLVPHLSPPLVIDKSNGSVYFNYFAFNITDLRQLEHFRGIFRMELGARDSSLARSLSARPLNLTLYLNYDLRAEVDGSAVSSPSSILRSTASAAAAAAVDLAGFVEFADVEMPTASNGRNFFQLVSNGVLLVILITVLMFMLFVACFLFVIFYKKNTSRDKEVDKASKQKSADSSLLNSTANSCLNKMRNSLKKKCSLVKSSSFGNLNAISSMAKKNDDNLTVRKFEF